MKNNGFTLIELLAVIVILAIIALIATPIVLGIIDDTKKSAMLRSAEFYLDGVENAVMRENMNNGGNFKPSECSISNGNMTCGSTTVEVEVDGEVPTTGSIVFENGKITSVTLNYESGTIVKNDGKLVYREKEETLAEVIVEDAKTKEYFYSETPNFDKITIDGEYGLYSAEDDYGTSYYFRGDVENNYVEFGTWAVATDLGTTTKPIYYLEYYDEEKERYYGTDESYDSFQECREAGKNFSGPRCYKDYVEVENKWEAGSPMYWRIVRINGDGTIRLVYDGVEKVKNGIVHTSVIGYSEYNRNFMEAVDVGYTYNKTDTNPIDSVIKSVLDSWYATNLESNYGSSIADSIFCNDRSEASKTYYDENNNTITDPNAAEEIDIYYGAYKRLNTDKTPSLKCPNQSDRYTMNDTANGNGLLSNPVGLITADEEVLAGNGLGSENYYLYNDNGLVGDEYSLWTFTPYRYNSDVSYAYVYKISNGRLKFCSVSDVYGVRPVINLKADVEFTGTGTIDDPYVIVTD